MARNWSFKQDLKMSKLHDEDFKITPRQYKGINSEFSQIDSNMNEIDKTFDFWGLRISSPTALAYFDRKKSGQ